VTAFVVTEVIRPFPFTVIVGMNEPLPNEPTEELTVASVPAAVTLPDPSNDGDVQPRSPVIAIVRPVDKAFAEVAVPDKGPENPVAVSVVPFHVSPASPPIVVADAQIPN
jgi:hypothetical protein